MNLLDDNLSSLTNEEVLIYKEKMFLVSCWKNKGPMMKRRREEIFGCQIGPMLVETLQSIPLVPSE